MLGLSLGGNIDCFDRNPLPCVIGCLGSPETDGVAKIAASLTLSLAMFFSRQLHWTGSVCFPDKLLVKSSKQWDRKFQTTYPLVLFLVLFTSSILPSFDIVIFLSL